MIPCAAKCPYYHEGCHKTCAEWSEYVVHMREESRAKSAWLKVHNQLCFDLVRTLRPISGCKVHY